MTTKKERRNQVAARTAARKAADVALGLAAQKADREKREQRQHDAMRAQKKKANALKMKEQYARSTGKSPKEIQDMTVGEFRDAVDKAFGFGVEVSES